MAASRVIYQDWIVGIGRDPGRRPDTRNHGPLHGFDTGGVASELPDGGDEIAGAVRSALDKLPAIERQFIECFYLMGMSYREIADQTGRREHRLEAVHKRAVARLRAKLAPFVRERFGLTCHVLPRCAICDSPHRKAIDALIAGRDPAGTWRPIIRRLRTEFGIEISTPQLLIGHEKYH